MTKLVPARYKKLLRDIEGFYRAAQKSHAEFFWNTGRRIVEEEQHGEIYAPYGKGLLEGISQDLTESCGLGFSVRNLQRMRTFYLSNRTPASDLNLSHQIELLPVKDKRRRLALAERAIREGLKAKEVRALVQAELVRSRVEKHEKPLKPLPPVSLGPYYTYQIISRPNLHSKKEERLLDLGFNQRLELDFLELFLGKTNFPAGTVVSSVKSESGVYSLKAEPSRLTADLLYTYKAYVEKVVDGDTFKLEILTGFGSRFSDKFRLKGIDCPELGTPEGERAKTFVEKELSSCDFITVKSTLAARREKWGRFVVDLFYSKEGREKYLNQVLLDEGHAVLMET